MTINLKDKLIELCKMNEVELFNHMKTFLKKHGYNIMRPSSLSYIIAEAADIRKRLPVCLVAHLDTVFYYPPTDFFYDQDNEVLWSPQGLGTDDRAGVLMIKNLIERGFYPSIILTTEEEQGGIGARVLTENYPECPFKNIKFLIELDRKAYNDCIFYTCDNKEFKEYISNFGFKKAIGIFTDIRIIAPQWGIAAVNLSVGYQNEHSNGEYIVLSDFKNIEKKVADILSMSKEAPFFKYTEKSCIRICQLCQREIPFTEFTYRFKDSDGEIYRLCEDCAQQVRAWNRD